MTENGGRDRDVSRRHLLEGGAMSLGALWVAPVMRSMPTSADSYELGSPPPPPPPAEDEDETSIMAGGGSVHEPQGRPGRAAQRTVTYSYRFRCGSRDKANRLFAQWSTDDGSHSSIRRFDLVVTDSLDCEQPTTEFPRGRAVYGQGQGTVDGVAGYRVTFRFTRSDPGASRERVFLRITGPSGSAQVVLAVNGQSGGGR